MVLIGNHCRMYPIWLFVPIILATLFSGCAGVAKEIQLTSTPSERPPWTDKGIVRKGGYIYVTGHSNPENTDQAARDDALDAATQQFVKYCKVKVEVFDRLVETYSQADSQEKYSTDVEHRSSARARAFVRGGGAEKWYVRHMATMKGKRQVSTFYVAFVLLKVPEEEFERISKEKDVRLSLDIGLYREAADDRLDQIYEGDVLRSGEGYALYIKPSDDCYLYVYQTDETGKSFRLFPNPAYETEKNPVRSAEALWIPNTERLLELDDVTGKEKVYLFASLGPMPELEGHFTTEEKELGRVIKTMGVAGLTEKRTPNRAYSPGEAPRVVQIKKKLLGRGDFVYETWFWHR